ncbi:MAG TPA: DUF1028 domain-containing protein [Terriglobales bacterium]|nr:DUF1028 domain-containing protein [Terriglobales bacterium]
MKLFKALCLCVSVLQCVVLMAQERPHRPVHTFSIVARDPQTGEMGAAVQSHWFSVGSNVIWAEAGVGAVATQSFIDPSYGPLGMALMKAGKSAPEALKSLLAGDSGQAVRQVAFVDAKGNVMSWTGAGDMPAAGTIVPNRTDTMKLGCGGGQDCAKLCPQKDPKLLQPCGGYAEIGKDFSAQANLMANDKIWPAMAKAYQESKGDLAERMLAALEAAQAVGGDIRGRQSAAIIIVKAQSSGQPWKDKVFDLRVDDAAEPIKELRRLVTLQRAYNHMNAGDHAVELGDHELALKEYSTAEDTAAKAEGVLPSRVAEMMYWHAVELVNINRVDESLPLFKKAFAMEKGWIELTPRLLKVGLLPNDPKLLERILSQSK